MAPLETSSEADMKGDTMSYTPNTWTTGDIITASKLNNMEQGIANAEGVLLVRENNDHTLDHTWKEITDSTFSVLDSGSGQLSIYMGGFSEDGSYGVGYWTVGMTEPVIFITNSQNGYPVLGE